MSNTPPNSIPAEESLIGAMLLNPGIVGDVVSVVQPKHFYSVSIKQIYKAIIAVTTSGAIADLITVVDWLEANEKIEQANGFGYIAEILKNTASASNHEAYSEIIIERYISRMRQEYAKKLFQGDMTPSDIAAEYEKLQPNKKSDIPITMGSDGFDAEIDFIVESVIPANSFGIIYGASESFKSFLAIDLACCIGSGSSWDGFQSDEGCVLYIAGEGQTGIARRIKAWEIKAGKKTKVGVIGQPVYMNDNGQAERVVKLVKQFEEDKGEKVKLLVIDTLARCISGDENTPQDMGGFIKSCDQVKTETSIAVLAVHHSGKDKAKGARGHSSLRGACDYEYRVDRDVESGSMSMVVECTKMKDGERISNRQFAMYVVNLGINDKYEKPITSLTLSNKSQKPVEKTPEKRQQKGNAGVEQKSASYILDQMRTRNGFNQEINTKLLRDCHDAWLGDSILPDAKRQRFKRAITNLQKIGKISNPVNDMIILID